MAQNKTPLFKRYSAAKGALTRRINKALRSGYAFTENPVPRVAKTITEASVIRLEKAASTPWHINASTKRIGVSKLPSVQSTAVTPSYIAPATQSRPRKSDVSAAKRIDRRIAKEKKEKVREQIRRQKAYVRRKKQEERLQILLEKQAERERRKAKYEAARKKKEERRAKRTEKQKANDQLMREAMQEAWASYREFYQGSNQKIPVSDVMRAAQQIFGHKKFEQEEKERKLLLRSIFEDKNKPESTEISEDNLQPIEDTDFYETESDDLDTYDQTEDEITEEVQGEIDEDRIRRIFEENLEKQYEDEKEKLDLEAEERALATKERLQRLRDEGKQQYNDLRSRVTDIPINAADNILDNVLEEISKFEPDSAWSKDLALDKEDEVDNLTNVIEKAIKEYGKNEVARAFQNNAAEITGLINEILRGSGGTRAQYKDKREKELMDITRINTILERELHISANVNTLSDEMNDAESEEYADDDE